MFLYNIAIYIYSLLLHVVAPFSPKARRWCRGQVGLMDCVKRGVSCDRPTVWVHVASLGEFEQGRPIMESIRQRYPHYQIVLTFFSPSGYDVRHKWEGADCVLYMPLDTRRNVTRFLDIVRPEVAIFVKYEYWLNYLRELHLRGVRTFVVSAIFRRDSIFFKPWGGVWRRALRSFETIFVQDVCSCELLAEIGVVNAMVAGDTRFDRVYDIASAARVLPLIERFKGDDNIFVAGSTWPTDEELLVGLVEHYPQVKFIIAPHEVTEERVEGLMAKLTGRAKRYTAYQGEEVQVLVLDTIGMLSSVYRYGKWGYIGGGFGVGIHNTLEAAIFGLPIAFGVNYKRFREACELIDIDVANSVESTEELCEWFSSLYNNCDLMQKTSQAARDYMEHKCGATSIIIDRIFQK